MRERLWILQIQIIAKINIKKEVDRSIAVVKWNYLLKFPLKCHCGAEKVLFLGEKLINKRVNIVTSSKQACLWC